MLCTTFNGNPCATILSCNCLTNAGDETDITIFYNELSSFVRHIPKHNVLIIGKDINAQIDNGGICKFYLQNSPNYNGEYIYIYIYSVIRRKLKPD